MNLSLFLAFVVVIFHPRYCAKFLFVRRVVSPSGTSVLLLTHRKTAAPHVIHSLAELRKLARLLK
ncbi:hypothetical protein ES705_44252 [subsurface metagenome]